MANKKDMIRFQAEEHPLERSSSLEAETEEALVLHLIHRKAYEVAALVCQGKRVLDFGCNNGYGTSILAERSASAVGVDVSPNSPW